MLIASLWSYGLCPITSLMQTSDSAAAQLLIDQELLLARAEALGLTATDPGLRKVMAAAAIDQITNNFLQQPVTETQLREFYQTYGSIFEQPKKIAAHALRLTDKASIRQAEIMLAEGKNLAHISQSLQLDSCAAAKPFIHTCAAPLSGCKSCQPHRKAGSGSD